MFRLLSLRHQFCKAAGQVRYKFQHSFHMSPHPEKAYKGGEDAVFTSDNVLLVADGVGGWIESGVDPALYSKRLAKIVEELVQKEPLKHIENPKDLIKEAVALNKETGSTTVCLLTLHPQTGIMKSYYLGDSVFAIYNTSKRSVMMFRQQQYEFNFPVQVGTGGANPEHGVYHEFKPEELDSADVIVAASDGIWDNLSSKTVYGLLEGQQLSTAAKDIAEFAIRMGTAIDYESPFYLKAKEAGIQYPKQGKLDDCSVILARVIKEEL